MADTLERIADSDERLRLVTVTAVDVAPDLRHAKVYLSSLTEASAGALAEHRAHLQQAIGRQVRLKRTPQLEFAADPAVAAGNRVEEILRHIHERDVHHSGAGGEEPGDPAPGAEAGGVDQRESGDRGGSSS